MHRCRFMDIKAGLLFRRADGRLCRKTASGFYHVKEDLDEVGDCLSLSPHAEVKLLLEENGLVEMKDQYGNTVVVRRVL